MAFPNDVRRARRLVDDGYVTLPFAMRQLGLGRVAVLTLIAHGRLRADRRAGQTFVDRESLAALKITGDEFANYDGPSSSPVSGGSAQ
jgi:hypothetical protein